MGTQEGEARSAVTSTTGGIMTEEVGAVTGALEVATRLPQARNTIEVTVRYVGVDEWYAVVGGSIVLDDANGPPPIEVRELHERVVGHLTTPGKIVKGNEEPTSLLRFSP